MSINTVPKYAPSCPEFSKFLEENWGAAARICDGSKILSLPTLSKYKSGQNRISLEGAIEIERQTSGVFRAEKLRPESADLIKFIRNN